jgi:hypothetical protein
VGEHCALSNSRCSLPAFRELAYARHLPFGVQPGKAANVVATFTDEWAVHHDWNALPPAGIEHETRTVISRDNAHGTAIRCTHQRAGEPSDLSFAQSGAIRAD